jgi:gamma-glutamyltranspeptidase/glutathione hydrolase
MRSMIRTAALLGLATASVMACGPAGDTPSGDVASMAPLPVAGRSAVYAPHGVVATSQSLASTVALRVLEQGGNAFDAAVAASAVLGLTEPHMTGIGGDMFALAWSAEDAGLVGLDASGRAGSRMSAEQIRADGFDRVPYQGPGSVTVPGAVAGWAALIERYGTMSLGDLLQPAIDLAENGFPVSPIIAGQWQAELDLLQEDEGASATYLMADGQAPDAGEWFTNPDLANSYRMIARDGASAMYGGDLGRAIVDGLEPMGGYLTLEDMAGMQVEWVDPISADYKDWTLWELPPAGQGIAALQMLELVEGFDLQGMGHNSPEYFHHLIEATKIAFADLNEHVSDRDHMRVTTDQLLDPGYIDQRRALIDPNQAAAERPEPGDFATQTETIYLAVADQYGNMVSFILSIYEYFGSGVVVPGTGFVMQNRGAGFTLEDGHPNQVAPGKRPFHTLIPGFVTRDGEPVMAFGVMGGSMQPQGHVQVMLNMVEFGMDPQEAIDAARYRVRGGPRVAIENVTPGLKAALEAMGHEVVDWENVAFGGGQTVMKLERGWAAGSDARKDGLAIGH